MTGSDRYPGFVNCPHCGAGVGEMCERTDSEGPTGVIRDRAHQERRELARVHLAAGGGGDLKMNDAIQHTKKTYNRKDYRNRTISLLILIIQAISAFVFLVTSIALGVYLGNAII